MKNILYIILLNTLSIIAQKNDSLNSETIGIDESTSPVSKISVDKKNEINNQKRIEEKDFLNTSNKKGIWSISIAIMVGLIPIMLQIWYSIKQYKKSQIDKYGAFLYEKQFPIYIQIFKKTENLYDIAQMIFLSLKNEWLSKFTKENKLNPEIEFLKELTDFRDFIKDNSLILPNDFLKKIFEFKQFNDIIRNTIDRKIIGKENILNKNLFTIDEKGGLKVFSKKYNENFYNLNYYLKNLLGTEYFTKQALKYTDKKKNNFIYLKDREAKI